MLTCLQTSGRITPALGQTVRAWLLAVPEADAGREESQMLFIGMDDTDTLESRGTGCLARQIAAELSRDYLVLGVTRHQLLVDPRVPCTRKNSCAAILLDGDKRLDPSAVLSRVRAQMLNDFQPGSDPGLCVASQVPPEIIAFGRRSQQHLVTQEQARELASSCSIPLLGLGGDEGGVIGALAAVGLAACGEDGRYVMVGRSRELAGMQSVPVVLATGIAAVRRSTGEPVTEGLVQTDKLRPARLGGQPVAVVTWSGDHWLPIKLD